MRYARSSLQILFVSQFLMRIGGIRGTSEGIVAVSMVDQYRRLLPIRCLTHESFMYTTSVPFSRILKVISAKI